MDDENRLRSRFAAQFGNGLKNVKFFLDPTTGRAGAADLFTEIESFEEAIAAGDRATKVMSVDSDIPRKRFDSAF
jgi:hypothetical protein